MPARSPRRRGLPFTSFVIVIWLFFQEQRSSQLPLELDQIGDDSASVRSENDVKGEAFDLFAKNTKLLRDYDDRASSFFFLIS